jgi:hypothetical protein
VTDALSRKRDRASTGQARQPVKIDPTMLHR